MLLAKKKLVFFYKFESQTKNNISLSKNFIFNHKYNKRYIQFFFLT